MTSPSATSTTLLVFANGALNTGIPRSRHESRSIWFVPMQNAPIAARSGAASKTRSLTRVLERMPSTVTSVSRRMSSESDRLDGSVLTSYPASVKRVVALS